ncbi:hypothetical protein O181_086705 [Austropuccinia psidii MF-1]|uniref:Uncharacterized protein n=1 Tax=Austropuccinia psidii MF-1 TaxID=1389203 RepID=A0A9Q3FUR7_9BASI|nr:hypothetical protein [Austropuccinia psidii MF-1]
MLPEIYQGVMNPWNILKRLLKEEQIVKYSNGWNTLSSKPKIKNIKDWHNKKWDASKEEAPGPSIRKPEASQPPQEEKKKKNWGELYSPIYRITRIPKDSM